MERLIAPSNRAAVRGLLIIHSAPAPLRRHIDWAVQSVLGNATTLEWRSQPLLLGTHRATLQWRDRAGKASELASTLRSWCYLRFEISENSETGGELFRCTPELGLHRATIDASGAILVSEYLVDNALKNSFDEDSLRTSISNIFGTPWELELERFRGVDEQERSHLQVI